MKSCEPVSMYRQKKQNGVGPGKYHLKVKAGGSVR